MKKIWKKIMASALAVTMGFSGNLLPGNLSQGGIKTEVKAEETQKLHVGIRLKESDQVVSQGGIYMVSAPESVNVTMICTMPASMPAMRSTRFELLCYNSPTPSSILIVDKSREKDAKPVGLEAPKETAAPTTGAGISTPSALTVPKEYSLYIPCGNLAEGEWDYSIQATDQSTKEVYDSNKIRIHYQKLAEPEPVNPGTPGENEPGMPENPGEEQPGKEDDKKPDDSSDPTDNKNENKIPMLEPITPQSIQVRGKSIKLKKIINRVKEYYESYDKEVTINKNKDIHISKKKIAAVKANNIIGNKYGKATIKVKGKIKGVKKKTTLAKFPLIVTPGKPVLTFNYDPKNSKGGKKVWSLKISKLDQKIIEKVEIEYGINKGKKGKKTNYKKFDSIKSKEIKRDGTYVTERFRVDKKVKYRFKVTVSYKDKKYDPVKNDGRVKKTS